MSKLKYDESFPERAGEYAAKGLNNREIAAQLGISNDSFYVYLRQFPEFAAAVETGRLAVADKLDGSLLDLAMGNCFVTTVRRGDSGHETRTIRRRAPDVNAIIRWLERNTQYAGDGDVRTSEPVKINIAVNSKYDESFLEDVERHAAEGYTDLQIAWRLGIALSSFYNYKKQFPDFAAALDSGRRECYGRLRGQLLALALGKCTVTTETCRDGDFRKSTERQLPPNLKAIKYWLTGANREVRSQESGVRMGTGAEDLKTRNQNGNRGRSLEDKESAGGCGRMGEPPLKSTPKCRSRTVARLLMLAAWAKQPPLKSTPKRRSRAVARLLMLAAWAKQPLLKSTPKRRSRAVARLLMLAAWAKQPPLKSTPKCRSRGRRTTSPAKPQPGSFLKCREKNVSGC